MPRAIDPQISFADLEFSRQGVRLDPLCRGYRTSSGTTPNWSRGYARTSSEVSRTPTPGEAA